MGHLNDFGGKSFYSVAKEDIDLGDMEDNQEKEERETAEKEAQDLVEKLKDVLKDKVKEVRITHRLTNSPTCLVVDEDEMAANLQRMLKSAGHAVPTSLPIMELNPTHPLVTRLNGVGDEAQLADWGNILFEQALLAEGGQLEDPASYVNRLNSLLVDLTQ